MRRLGGALMILGGLALLAFGSIGLLFALGGQPPDAGAVGFTGACVVIGLVFCGLGLRRLLQKMG